MNFISAISGKVQTVQPMKFPRNKAGKLTELLVLNMLMSLN